jgi:prevent-host-death family protein
MPRVGIRELKAHASEIVRALREDKVHYIVTHQGQPVGVLSPIDEQQLDAILVQATATPTDVELAAELDELSQEIARRWKGSKSGVKLVSEMRD